MNDETLTCLKLFLSELPEKYKVPLEMYEFKEMLWKASLPPQFIIKKK